MTHTAPANGARARQAYAEALAETAVEAVLDAGAHLHSGGRFADVGCGRGEVSLVMAEWEFTVTAHDASPAMVEATRELCAGHPVSAEVRHPRTLRLAEGAYEVVHSSWTLQGLADARGAVRTMARAAVPGGLVVLQWSHDRTHPAAPPAGEVLRSLAREPRWEARLAAVPVEMHPHRVDEVCAVLREEGLEILLAQDDVRLYGEDDGDPARETAGGYGGHRDDETRLGSEAYWGVALAAQAEALGGDGEVFVDEAVRALSDAGALDVRHVRVVARRPPRARAPERPRSPVRAFPLSVGLLEVVSSRPLSPLMRRVVMRVAEGSALPVEEPAETITLIWPAPGAAEIVLPEQGRWRFPAGAAGQHTANITVRRYDRGAGLVTADFFVHGSPGEHGAHVGASAWACRAVPGDRVGFGGTRVHWVADPSAEWTLLVGDETALPSIAAVAETLPAGRPSIAVVEVRDAAEHAALDAPHPDVRWVHRGARPPGRGRALEDVVRGLDLPPGRGQVWAGGESLMIQSLRRHLLSERGLRRDEVCALGYWSIPRADRDPGA
ncbi:SIP domain-containing protein [Sphaerisporangium sp. TRM90804]|uniref:SIP domain-containing protein n=1 Tax=Sphaerisporangium sp. TRM90804 TaxID=3031113 RepID=UPI002447CE4F|nr:SIP domain-containing protein [Sphaerisporangium sp. TRM90804]MDH2428000.1 SIP domain-containing protein [Sphaerisporangium sp. TRM90804]